MNKTYIKRNFLKHKNKSKTHKIKGGEVRQGEVKQGEVRQGEVRQGEVRQGEVRPPMMKPNNNPLKTNKNNLKLNGLSNQDYKEKKINDAMNGVKDAEANLATAKLNEVNAVKNIPITQAATKMAETKLQEAKNILNIISPPTSFFKKIKNFFTPNPPTQA